MEEANVTKGDCEGKKRQGVGKKAGLIHTHLSNAFEIFEACPAVFVLPRLHGKPTGPCPEMLRRGFCQSGGAS